MNLIKLLAKALGTTPDNIEYEEDNLYAYDDTEYVVGTYDDILDYYVDTCTYNYEDGYFDDDINLCQLKNYVNKDRLCKYFVKDIKNYFEELFDDEEVIEYAREYGLIDEDQEPSDSKIEWLRKKLPTYLIGEYGDNPIKFYCEDTNLGELIQGNQIVRYDLIDCERYFEDYFKEYVAKRMFKLGNDTYAIERDDMAY
jgi:hypothetical protein